MTEPEVVLVKETGDAWHPLVKVKLESGPGKTVVTFFIISFSQPGILAFSRISCAVVEVKACVRFCVPATNVPFNLHSQMVLEAASKVD